MKPPIEEMDITDAFGYRTQVPETKGTDAQVNPGSDENQKIQTSNPLKITSIDDSAFQILLACVQRQKQTQLMEKEIPDGLFLVGHKNDERIKNGDRYISFTVTAIKNIDYNPGIENPRKYLEGVQSRRLRPFRVELEIPDVDFVNRNNLHRIHSGQELSVGSWNNNPLVARNPNVRGNGSREQPATTIQPPAQAAFIRR